MASPYDADIDLLERITAGDRAAWGVLVTEHRQTVRFAIIRTLARHGAAASDDTVDDLFGDLMLRLAAERFKRLRGYGGRCSLRQWLKVVASNFAIDHLRRLRPTVPLGTGEVGEPSGAVEIVDDAPTPDEELEERQRRDAAAALLAQLNEEDQLFVELFYARGLSYEEVAELMGTTLGAVYARRNRIRKRLTALADEAALL